jgi:hypothetical protein
MKELIVRFLLVIISVLMCLAAVEVTLRFVQYGTAGKREGNVVHYVNPEFEHYATFNSLNLRDSEIAPKKRGEFRICAIGDSFTFGLGVDEEKTFVRRSEHLLRQRVEQVGLPINVRIINCGVGGGPYKQHDWLREVGVTLKPDLVVQAFFIGNDLYDDQRYIKKSSDTQQNDVRQVLGNILILDWLWNHLVSVPFVDQILFQMGLRYENRGLFLKDQPEYERRAWNSTLKKLLEIRQTLQNEGIYWLVMIIPTSDQVRYGHMKRQDENHRLPNEILARFFSQNQIQYIDFLTLIENGQNKDDFYYRRDLHWTEQGHSFAAKVLADQLWSLIAGRT